MRLGVSPAPLKELDVCMVPTMHCLVVQTIAVVVFNLANKGWTANKAGNNADTNISDIVESVCLCRKSLEVGHYDFV